MTQSKGARNGSQTPYGSFLRGGRCRVTPESPASLAIEFFDLQLTEKAMQSFPLSNLAEQFEVDRSVMVKALRGTPPDLMKPGNRPAWRIATAAAALEAYRIKKHGNSRGIDPALQADFDRLDSLDASVRSAPTVEKRREFARRLFAVLTVVDRAMRDEARRGGEDSELTGYRCDQHLRSMLSTLRQPCGWDSEQMLNEFNRTTSEEPG